LTVPIDAMQRVAGTPDDFVELATGSDHVCGITATGTVWCWGYNDDGQAGQFPAPVTKPGGIVSVGLPQKPAIHVAAGDSKTCVILGDTAAATQGELWCWGYNPHYEISPGAPVILAERLTPAADWTAVSVGNISVCGIRGGHAWCWGGSTAG